MIEPMKKVTVAYQTAKKKQLVMALRNLGLMHIVDVVQKGEESDRREKDKAAVQKENHARTSDIYCNFFMLSKGYKCLFLFRST